MSLSITESNFRKPYRIARSISEQESIVAAQSAPQENSPNDFPNDFRDLMDVRTRGIFDDRDVTDLIKSIQRTERALNAVKNPGRVANQSPVPSLTPNNIISNMKGIMPTLPTRSSPKPLLKVGSPQLSRGTELTHLSSTIGSSQRTNRESAARSPQRSLEASVKSVGFAPDEPKSKSSAPSQSSTSISSSANTHVQHTVSQAKSIIVRSIDQAKSAVSTMSTESVARTREKLAQHLDEAITAISSASASITDQAKTNLDHHLNQARLTTSTMTLYNVEQARESLSHHLEEALMTVLPTSNVRSMQPSCRRSLARQIIDFNVKDPSGNHHREKNATLKSSSSAKSPTSASSLVNLLDPPSSRTKSPALSPDISANGTERMVEDDSGPDDAVEAGTTIDEAACLEAAINDIKENCPDVELILFISPIQNPVPGKQCYLKITAVSRSKQQILGNILLPKLNVLEREGLFSKYFTVRVSQDFKNFENDIGSLIHYLNKTPSGGRYKPSKQQKPPSNRFCIIQPPSTIRRSIKLKSADEPYGDPDKGKEIDGDVVTIEREPTILELLEKLSKRSSSKELNLLFTLVENHNFVIYARPDYRDQRSVYICELFTSTKQFIGTTKLSGEDILQQLRKHPSIISNFEIVVDVVDIMLPFRIKQILGTLFEKTGLVSMYDRLGTYLFDIYKQWMFGDVLRNNDASC